MIYQDNSYLDNTKMAPQDEYTLLERARALAGHPIHSFLTGDPSTFLKNKGNMGLLTELLLHAEAKSKPIPDFPSLGIELKTLPITSAAKVLESTYVCTAPLQQIGEFSHWEHSRVRLKLKKVLWLPIIGERKTPFYNRIFGTAFLWSPTVQEETILAQDYHELVEAIQLGDFNLTTAYHGEILQLRPKAPDGKPIHTVIDADGLPHRITPMGFYLRAQFTQQLLKKLFFTAT